MAYGPGQAFPPLPAVPAGSGFTGVNPAWLAGNADRERAVGVLRAAFTEGRLTQDELDDRVARAYAARTYGDLWTLIADLPAGPLPYPGGVPYQQATPAVPPSAVIRSASVSTCSSMCSAIRSNSSCRAMKVGPFTFQ